MSDLSFDWQIDEFMVFCRSRQLREKTMDSYEQSLRLFQRWCEEQMNVFAVDKVTKSIIRRYINDLQERGKYLFYADDMIRFLIFSILFWLHYIKMILYGAK